MYDDDFYTWWERQVPALEQFPYAGLDFRGDPDLVLPPGGAWGEMGKSFFIFYHYQFFMDFQMIGYIHMHKSKPYLCVKMQILDQSALKGTHVPSYVLLQGETQD